MTDYQIREGLPSVAVYQAIRAETGWPPFTDQIVWNALAGSQFGFVAIEGTLRVQDFGAGSKLGLTASHIVINGGAFLVGSRAKPHLGDFDITLTGRRED